MKLFEFFSVASVKDHDPRLDHDKDSQTEREKLANELFWYILDHDDIHKKHVMPIAQDIARAKKKGNVDMKKYTECWMPMVEEACLEFHKEEKMPHNPRKLFDREFREELCKRLAEKYVEDIKKDRYKLGD
jgi:hypothetical protein